MTVKSSRWLAPILPNITSPICSASPKRTVGSPSAARMRFSTSMASTAEAAARAARDAVSARSAGDGTGKIASMPSPMNFRISPPALVTMSPIVSK